MFIEYEIKEYDETYSSILNTEHVVGIEVAETEVVIWLSSETIRFALDDDANFLLFDAFKRALCGESVTIEGIGYVRPLKPTIPPITPSLDPIKAITWRDCA